MSRPQKNHLSRDNTVINTRQALLNAVLDLMNNNMSFDSVSLRKVTAAVGVNPSAFYRHFPDMNALGLELVGNSFKTLRQILKSARSTSASDKIIIRKSVEAFVTHVRANQHQFQFIAREHFGGVAVIRQKIEHEHQLLASELAIDLARYYDIKQWSSSDLQMLASLMINSMVAITERSLLARQRGEDDSQLIETAVKQLRLIMLGALHWRSI